MSRFPMPMSTPPESPRHGTDAGSPREIVVPGSPRDAAVSPRLADDGEVLTLNVGGILYTTTRATLSRHPDSMLGAMFGGRYRPTTARDRSGNYFIDRDGVTFRYVLNYLRTARLCLPRGYADFDLLEAEVDFYQIPALCATVRSLRTGVDGEHASAAPGRGRYLEMLDFEETAYFHRFYSDPPRGIPPDLKNGGLVLSGERDLLLKLPLPEKTLTELRDSDWNYRTVNVSGGSGTGSCFKMAIIDELQSAGWQLVNMSFANSTDTDGSYMVHKYMWHLPAP